MSINLKIKNVKNIRYADLQIPFEKGIYAFVGENGCGKSTLMLALSLIVKKSSMGMFLKSEIYDDSYIKLNIDGIEDVYNVKNGQLSIRDRNVRYQGFYEGSIFYGSRFHDYNKIDAFLEEEDYVKYLVNADDFVAETLGYILHNNNKYYTGLKKIKNRRIAEEKGFRGIPYFLEVNGNIISQYQMSSGESMLISLIDFINNLVIKSSYQKLLLLIDEVELALHPSAIDRLLKFLNDLIYQQNHELVIYFSTHSSEVIFNIKPDDIFMLDNYNGNMGVTNPCYPNYAVRRLYVPNGFDFLILVEDKLAKVLVEKMIRDNNLGESKLCCVLPSGGYIQVANLHKDIMAFRALGIGKKLISVFDGDVKTEVEKLDSIRCLPHCFLPIKSIEKYLKQKLVEDVDLNFVKTIGDKYFTQRSLEDILADYNNNFDTNRDKNGKQLYKLIISNLNSIGIDEDKFLEYICGDIYKYENLSSFVSRLASLLQ